MYQSDLSIMKVIREWFVDVPWGKVALISWGNPQGKPVLLVHGRQDSAATFIPMLKLMPETYHYVAIDMPGHGYSDPLPKGIVITRFFGTVVIDMVIRHLGWREFIYIGHSMGAEQGLFYNVVCPGQIKKFILLDAGPSLQRLVIGDFVQFYQHYDEYYGNYAKYNTDVRIYTKLEALRAVMNARGMTQDEAEVILSRNLKKIGNDQYRLSWEKRAKIMAPMNCPPEYYYEIFSKNSPPTLFISANQSFGDYYSEGKKVIEKLVGDLEKNVANFIILRVDGNHDVHFLNPKIFIKELCAFLAQDFGVRSKL